MVGDKGDREKQDGGKSKWILCDSQKGGFELMQAIQVNWELDVLALDS